VRSPYDFMNVPAQLVSDFFAFFSRMEYALKAAGYVRGVRGRATPDWRRFGEVVAPQLDAVREQVILDAVAYLTNEPPLVQTLKGWEHRVLKGNGRGERAIDAAQRVRHNLFHGGKHTPESKPGRDLRLVESAYVVLKAALELEPHVEHAFSN